MLTKILWFCLAVEAAGAAAFSVMWLTEPIPPRPDLSHYHPATSDEIRSLEKKVLDNGTAENWLTLGKMYLLFGLFPEAEYCCNKTAYLDSTSFGALYWWGVAFNQLGETSQAIDKFRQALPLAENQAGDPDAAARCWYGIGRNYLRQEDVAHAENAFREAADFLPARHQLIRILVRSQRAAEAIPMLDDLTVRYPNESTFYQLRAVARDQLGDKDGAFEDRSRVERVSNSLKSDSIIAQLQMEAGQVGLYRELRECDRLLAQNPQEAVTRLRKLLAAQWRTELAGLLVEAEMRIGNAQQAVDLLKKMMACEGTTAEQLEQHANGYRWLSKGDIAFQLRKRASQMRHIKTVHANLGRDYLKQGKTELARKHRALARMTDGIAAFREDQISEASSVLQQALGLNKELPNAWYYLAECHRVRRETAQAIEAYRNCLKADANHGRARSRLSRLTKSRAKTN